MWTLTVTTAVSAARAMYAWVMWVCVFVCGKRDYKRWTRTTHTHTNITQNPSKIHVGIGTFQKYFNRDTLYHPIWFRHRPNPLSPIHAFSIALPYVTLRSGSMCSTRADTLYSHPHWARTRISSPVDSRHCHKLPSAYHTHATARHTRHAKRI